MPTSAEGADMSDLTATRTVVRLLSRLVVLVALGAVAALLSAAAASPKSPVVYRVMTEGYAYSLYGDCDVPVPSDGTVCHETEITVWKEADTSTSTAGPHTPWILLVDHIVTSWSGGDYTVLDYSAGVTTDVAVSFDQAQLSSVTARGAVTFDDGSTATVNVAWTAVGPLNLFANDGPASGAPSRHYVDKCVTQNANAHQKNRTAVMTGTLNGTPIRSYEAFDFAAFIARNHFVFVTAAHQGAC